MALISDLTPSVVRLMGNRSDVAALTAEAMGETIKELSNNYPFEELRETGPIVQFVPGQNAYALEYFLAAPIAGVQHEIGKVISWFFYLNQPISLVPGVAFGYSNPGYGLKFRDIEDLEVLVNTVTLPQFWSQLGNQLFVAATPNRAYYTYCRYQYLHPFTEPIAQPTDPILMPDTWFDIIEYATAERIALNLRMQDVADRYHSKLFGDPTGKGEVGMISRRISQTRKNQSRTTRAIRLVRG
jgi:hypothetical protein